MLHYRLFLVFLDDMAARLKVVKKHARAYAAIVEKRSAASINAV